MHYLKFAVALFCFSAESLQFDPYRDRISKHSKRVPVAQVPPLPPPAPVGPAPLPAPSPAPIPPPPNAPSAEQPDLPEPGKGKGKGKGDPLAVIIISMTGVGTPQQAQPTANSPPNAAAPNSQVVPQNGLPPPQAQANDQSRIDVSLIPSTPVLVGLLAAFVFLLIVPLGLFLLGTRWILRRDRMERRSELDTYNRCPHIHQQGSPRDAPQYNSDMRMPDSGLVSQGATGYDIEKMI